VKIFISCGLSDFLIHVSFRSSELIWTLLTGAHNRGPIERLRRPANQDILRHWDLPSSQHWSAENISTIQVPMRFRLLVGRQTCGSWLIGGIWASSCCLWRG
jgi:hypothetical protein